MSCECNAMDSRRMHDFTITHNFLTTYIHNTNKFLRCCSVCSDYCMNEWRYCEKGWFYLLNIKIPDCTTDCKDSGGSRVFINEVPRLWSISLHQLQHHVHLLVQLPVLNCAAHCLWGVVEMESKRCSNTTPDQQREKWIVVFHLLSVVTLKI